MKDAAADVTQLLQQWKTGDRGALDRLIPIVYPELRAIAARQLGREAGREHLQTTAIVNEAYVRLLRGRELDCENRGHFFAIAAQLMRRILVDHARRRQRSKRGSGSTPIAIDESITPTARPNDALDALDLDRALQKLEQFDPEEAKIVELRFFGGLTIEETAATLGISVATVKREWNIAKSWLYRELTA